MRDFFNHVACHRLSVEDMEGCGEEHGSLTVCNVHQVATVIRTNNAEVLIIDSRSFLEFNTCHIAHAINICCSKLVKRRLQQDKVTVKELISQNCHLDAVESSDVIVYDEMTEKLESISQESFLHVLICKLQQTFRNVSLLSGGFLGFQAAYPRLCENKNAKCVTLTTHSQPCMPVSSSGPTKILPFLYLGTVEDALDKKILSMLGISYILNLTANCARAEFIQDNYFLRIPVNDNYSEKLLPWFNTAFQFLDKVRESHASVLLHCMAGISRSPTFAIGYVMKHLQVSSDDAYRYVKEKRPVISPNFNFLGQLLEWERILQSHGYVIQSGTPLRRPNPSPTPTPTTSVKSPGAMTLKVDVGQPRTTLEEKTVKSIPTCELDKISFVPCLTKECSVNKPFLSSSKLSITCAGDESVTYHVRVTCPIEATVTRTTTSLSKTTLENKHTMSVCTKHLGKPTYLSVSRTADLSQGTGLSVPRVTDTGLKPVFPLRSSATVQESISAPAKFQPQFVKGKQRKEATPPPKQELPSPSKAPLFVFGKSIERRTTSQTDDHTNLKSSLVDTREHPTRPSSILLSVKPDWCKPDMKQQQTNARSESRVAPELRKQFVSQWQGQLQCERASNSNSSTNNNNSTLHCDNSDPFLGLRTEPSYYGTGSELSPNFTLNKRHLSCDSQDSGLGPSPCKCEDCLGISADSVFKAEPFAGFGGTKVGENSVFYVEPMTGSLPPLAEGDQTPTNENVSPPISIPDQRKVYCTRTSIQVL